MSVCVSELDVKIEHFIDKKRSPTHANQKIIF